MPEAGDIAVDGEDGSFRLRCVGVAFAGRRVLLHTLAGHGYWLLPGGKVRLGEPSVDALRREICEELGREVEVGPLRVVVENIYRESGRTRHSIGLYHEIHGVEPDLRPGEWAAEHEFRWFDVADLDAVDLRPPGIVSVLREWPEVLTHLTLDAYAPRTGA
jgi:8-oxo-dGTP pyrophosphatase MutT (NUDIX family)